MKMKTGFLLIAGLLVSGLSGYAISELNDEINWMRYYVEPGMSGWKILAKDNADLKLDAVGSSILLRHTGYAYLLAANNIYTSTLMPMGAETPPNIGDAHTPYGEIHGEDLYGTVHNVDLLFTGLKCPICERPFSIGDKIVLIVTGFEENEIRCVPAHQNCPQ